MCHRGRQTVRNLHLCDMKCENILFVCDGRRKAVSDMKVSFYESQP
jgi:hypothetical protein